MATFSRTAILEWQGDVPRGSGRVVAGSGAFSIPATFPRIAGDPPGTTPPEELLAASHATCFGIGLRSILSQRGGQASRLRVRSTITARKDRGTIRLESAQLVALLEDVEGVAVAALDEIAHAAEQACTISAILRPTVPVTVSIRVATSPDEEF
ncbi:MAG: OsmC family protein [Gemmatimonadaceae bacterium]